MSSVLFFAAMPETSRCLNCGGKGYTVTYGTDTRGFVHKCLSCDGSGEVGGVDPLKRERRRVRTSAPWRGGL